MGVQPDQSTYDGHSTASESASASASANNMRKRKRTPAAGPYSIPKGATSAGASCHRDHSKGGNGDGDVDGDEFVTQSNKKKAKKAKIGKDLGTAELPAEKRLRRFRLKAPSSFQPVYERATTQRFFLISRSPSGKPECPEELFELTGSTGNIYRVQIQKQPTCDCPHAKAGNQCKHVVWCLKSILRAPDALTYQLALLSTELRDIFANAPATADKAGAGEEKDKNRKAVDGDCPICFEEMRVGDNKEPLVWCRAACGQNIHKECFEMWAATKKAGSGAGRAAVSCPYCRSAWEGDSDMINKINTSGSPNSDGYVNVADQIGISTERDYSTYSTWWTGHPGYRGRRR